MTDVAVYGATAAGVAAALAAHDAGAQTVLLDPGAHIGGMVSGGLSWTDVGDVRVLGGFARRFYGAVAEHYRAPLWGVRGPEPRVAEAILTAWLDGLDVRLGTGEVPDAAVYVDASYEGDLMAGMGVPFAVGREPRSLYEETWAGRQPAYRPGKHNFSVLLSPFASDGELLPHVRQPELDARGWPAERLAEGDGGLQAYGYRVCLTDRDPIPFPEPDGYDPGEYELLRRYLAAAPGAEVLGLVSDLLPGGKCDVNSIGPFSLNVLDGSNREYLDGDRAAVRAHHLRYTQGLLYFLSGAREDVARWGLCRDEFTDTDGWPHQLYVRDARRMRGRYVLREADLLDAHPQTDVVALGSYNIDIREVERTWRRLPEYDAVPAVFNEGYLSVAVPPYPIPYRSLVPRRQDAANLLVPICLSASHVAFASVRMEPTLMLLGEAAGLAAAQAARRCIAVQDIDVDALQRSLRDRGQVLSL
ncbi:MAG TPA: FAD-dependent oxidoreductase [Solirubrobacteraceae bacterium]|nr:FAD-dependent oxidoreductase [Solirubrobacteraceae bacterium]